MADAPALFFTPDEALAYLGDVGRMGDAAIDVFEAALALSYLNHAGVSLDKYRQHRTRLAEDVAGAIEGPGLQAKVQALAQVFTGRHGYIGDDLRYNDLQNADLMRVIDRRLGLPISLAILCITIGRDLGWDVTGINFPGHYIMRVAEGPDRAIIDPFQGCLVLAASDLRDILKKTMGPQAELSASYYEPASNRDTLVRLQNNIKLRQIEAEDYQGALLTVETMRRIAPAEYRLDLDAGVLLARLERPMAAIEALERYLEQVPNLAEKQEAALMLQQLRTRLN